MTSLPAWHHNTYRRSEEPGRTTPVPKTPCYSSLLISGVDCPDEGTVWAYPIELGDVGVGQLRSSLHVKPAERSPAGGIGVSRGLVRLGHDLIPCSVRVDAALDAVTILCREGDARNAPQ